MQEQRVVRPMSVVVYAKDCERLAGFYQSLLQLARAEQSSDFVLLASADLEIAVVQAPPAIADRIEVGTPPDIRSGTPIKASFAVADLGACRSAALASGGGLKPAGSAWVWREALHLDGWDPEGNVFQLRQPA